MALDEGNNANGCCCHRCRCCCAEFHVCRDTDARAWGAMNMFRIYLLTVKIILYSTRQFVFRPPLAMLGRHNSAPRSFRHAHPTSLPAVRYAGPVQNTKHQTFENEKYFTQRAQAVAGAPPRGIGEGRPEPDPAAPCRVVRPRGRHRHPAAGAGGEGADGLEGAPPLPVR